MYHAANPEELLEIPGQELGPVVGDDPRAGVGVSFACALDDRLDVGFGHARADLPVDDQSAAAVEQAAEVVERAGDVDAGHVHVPVLVGPERPWEAFPFE